MAMVDWFQALSQFFILFKMAHKVLALKVTRKEK